MLTKVEGPDANGNKIYTFGSQQTMQTPECYDVYEIIGRGAYGIVCSAVDLKTGDAVAIKKVSRLFEDAVDAKRLLREIKLLAFLDHPNILSLKDLFRPSNVSTFSDLYIVTDLMETDMQALLRSPRIRLKAGHCQYFTLQLLCALQYMHSAHVIHRDLKPGNLLTDGECNLKLCDFGLARGLGTNMTHYVVTRWYRPPELLLVCDNYDYEVDLWAAGCLAVEMITGKPLFTGRDYINQINLIIEYCGTPDEHDDLPENISSEALEYIRSLTHRPRKTLVEIVPCLRTRFDDSDFFDSFDDDDDDNDNDNNNNCSGDNVTDEVNTYFANKSENNNHYREINNNNNNYDNNNHDNNKSIAATVITMGENSVKPSSINEDNANVASGVNVEQNKTLNSKCSTDNVNNNDSLKVETSGTVTTSETKHEQIDLRKNTLESTLENNDSVLDTNQSSSSRSELTVQVIESNCTIEISDNKANMNSTNTPVIYDNEQNNLDNTDRKNVKIQRSTPDEYYAMFEDFISKLLTFNPAKRITAKEAIAHPWLADVRGSQMSISGCEANKTFYWDGDDKELSIDELRPLFVQEINRFRTTK